MSGSGKYPEWVAWIVSWFGSMESGPFGNFVILCRNDLWLDMTNYSDAPVSALSEKDELVLN